MPATAPAPARSFGPVRLFRSSGPAAEPSPPEPGDGAGGLLADGYRRTDRMLGWLLVGHLPLIFALAFLHDTWTAVLLWGLPTVAAGFFAGRRWTGTLFSRLALATALLVVSALLIHQTGGMIDLLEAGLRALEGARSRQHALRGDGAGRLGLPADDGGRLMVGTAVRKCESAKVREWDVLALEPPRDRSIHAAPSASSPSSRAKLAAAHSRSSG